MTHEAARTFVKEHIKRRGHEPVVEATEAMVRRWWGVLNAAVFYGRLHKPVEVSISRTRGHWGWAETIEEMPGRITLRLQPNYVSRTLFLTVLVHEMVHAWEHQHHTTMGHAKRFFAWKNRIKWTIGLELSERIKEDEYRYE